MFMYFCLFSPDHGFYFEKTDASGSSSRIIRLLSAVHRVSLDFYIFHNTDPSSVHPVYDHLAENDN